jgi:hypothetical protein
MTDYLAEVRRMEKFFDGFGVRYVPRLDNRDTDHLVWITSSRDPIPSDVIIETDQALDQVGGDIKRNGSYGH